VTPQLFPPDALMPSVDDAVAAGSGLVGRLVAREGLAPETIETMFALLSSHFTGVEGATFQSDLAEKNAVILLEDLAGGLRGFSTLAVYASQAVGRPVTVVYSGDTIVERAWWGSPVLARAWIRSVRRLVPATAEVYWLLLTSGFRTYRFLPVFFHAFHPRVDRETPNDERALVDAMAAERFGARYDAATGLVRLARPQVLADQLLEVPEGRGRDPHVRYFLERNPGFVNGDELACLTRIHDDNLTAAGRRMAR
jgi:hypothetical protein